MPQPSPSGTVSKARGIVVMPIIQKPQLEPPHDLIQSAQSGSCSAPIDQLAAFGDVAVPAPAVVVARSAAAIVVIVAAAGGHRR